MTREEFIDGYMERSGLDANCRTERGFRIGHIERIALPCTCGDEACKGWAMVPTDFAEDHMRRYGTAR